MYNQIRGIEPSWTPGRIPKKSGGFRKIQAPSEPLKDALRQIKDYTYSSSCSLRVSSITHGFEFNKSPTTAIQSHNKLSEVIVSMDLKDFFDNFKAEKTIELLEKNGQPITLSDDIKKFATINGHFPQGSPASPHLINLGMSITDRHIDAFARKLGFTVTRYADDLTFTSVLAPSGRSVSNRAYLTKRVWKLIFGVITILKKEQGLNINAKKLSVAWREGSKPFRVLGQTIRKDGKGYNAEPATRRKARAMIHNLYKTVSRMKYGIEALRKDFEQARGLVNWCLSVRAASGSEECYKWDPVINKSEYKYLYWRFKLNGKRGTRRKMVFAR